VTDKVLYESRDGVAWITLNRPEVHNAIDIEMRDALWALLDAAEARLEKERARTSGGS